MKTWIQFGDPDLGIEMDVTAKWDYDPDLGILITSLLTDKGEEMLEDAWDDDILRITEDIWDYMKIEAQKKAEMEEAMAEDAADSRAEAFMERMRGW